MTTKITAKRIKSKEETSDAQKKEFEAFLCNTFVTSEDLVILREIH